MTDGQVLSNIKYPMFYIFDLDRKRLLPRSKTFSTQVVNVYHQGQKYKNKGCSY